MRLQIKLTPETWLKQMHSEDEPIETRVEADAMRVGSVAVAEATIADLGGRERWGDAVVEVVA